MNALAPRRRLVRTLPDGQVIVETAQNRSPLPASLRVQGPKPEEVAKARKLLEGIGSEHARAGKGSCNWRGAH